MPATAISLSNYSAPTLDDAKAVALRSIAIMVDGTREDFDEVCHPEFLNHERHGRAAGLARAGTRDRLRDRALAARRLRRPALGHPRSGRRGRPGRNPLHDVRPPRRPFAAYAADGSVEDVFPPTGERFATTQTHWLRVRDGQVIEHWADRDDLGMAKQLGWVPPTPAYLLRMALAKRRARRAHSS